MIHETAIKNGTKNVGIIGKRVKHEDNGYRVNNVILIPKEHGQFMLFANTYLYDKMSFESAINPFIEKETLEIGLFCTDINNKRDAILRLSDIEFI